ncbi:MAG: hypothetical protein CMH57_06700 [Myxococcales bacterium]|nr:hypothetical protein [Myxococcales bacterium]
MASMSKLARLVGQNLKRNTKDFVFSSFGIVVGISTFIFFVALGQGIKTVVLEEIFVISQLEVVLPSYDVGVFRTEGSLFGGGRKLDDQTVEELRKLEGVSGVYPKMRFEFPARGWGGQEIIGKTFWTEMIADGIPAELVQPDLKNPEMFRDWDAAPIACSDDAGCPSGRSCGGAGVCEKQACEPPPVDRRGRPQGEDPCPGKSYCGQDTSQCEMPVPVVGNPRLLEVYNGSVHTAMKGSNSALAKLPRLTPDALVGFSFNATLGRSYLGESGTGEPRTRKFEVVGFSPKAIAIGATMPIGYVQRFNAMYREKDTAETYHSLLVEAERNEYVAELARRVTEEMGLALDERYESAQKAGLVITIVTSIFTLISVIIILIAAVNIMHTFLMVITDRRRELGIMRAVGATRASIRVMVLMEATVIGAVGGAIGCGLGVLAAVGVDAAFARLIGDFPFKPDSLFVWEPWFFAAGLGGGILFCLVGALIPAIRASNMDPAAALTGH